MAAIKRIEAAGRLEQDPAMRILLLILLGLSAGVISGFSHGDDDIVAEELVKTTRSWNQDVLPEYPEGQPEVTLLKITIPPKATLPMHKHPVINCGYLLRGELVVTSDEGEVLHLKEGDAISELVDQWHYGKNPGEKPAVILVFYAGTPGTPITVLQEAEAEAAIVE